MTSGRQLPLEFDHRPALEGGEFLVAPPNTEAVAWVDRWPDWPGPLLVVWGTEGSGKSHLAQAFLARTVGRMLVPGALSGAAAVMGGGSMVLEDVDRLLGDVSEEDLFHLFNAAKESGGHILMTARTPPVRWPLSLADLRSRLVGAPAVGISAPDDTLLSALVVKHFSDRQLKVDAEVVTYLVARMDRTFRAARNLVAAIDAEALSKKRKVTVPLVREILKSAGSAEN